MLRPRIIPCLLISDDGLVKTVRFDDPKYVGDPLNAVRIFNEKQVDELTVLDIDATVQGREPDYGRIRTLATECRMPLCYGGGVRTPDQVERIISLGVEKVAICSAWLADPGLIPAAAARVGRQSIVAVIDVKRRGLFSRREVMTLRGSRPAGLDPVHAAVQAERQGAGEIVLNDIDREGTMKGYDLDLAAEVRAAIALPMTVMGGAGSRADLVALIRRIGICGAAAGSLFVFKGSLRAVLINYPRPEDKDALVAQALAGGV